MAENTSAEVSRKYYRYKILFDEFFPLPLYQTGPVVPDTEYLGPNRQGPQRRDPVTGLLVWRIAVTDQNEPNTKRRAYDVLLLSDTEPVPTTEEIADGLRPIRLEGVTVQPRVGGTGEFKYLDRIVRATGYAPAPAASGRGSGSAAGSGSGKSAG